MQENIQTAGSKNVFSVLYLLLCLLIPIAIFPGAPALLFASKLIVISSLGALLLIFYFLNTLNKGSIELPRTKIVFALLLLPLAALVSAFFTGSPMNSLVGNVFEVGTAGLFIVLYFLFLISVFAGLQEGLAKRVNAAFLIAMGVSVLRLLVEVVRGSSLSFLNNVPLSLVGNFVDLSLLLGAGVVLSLCLLNLASLGQKTKVGLWALLALSLVYVGAIAFKPVIYIVGVFSLVMFIYLISVSRQGAGLSSERNSWIKKSYSSLFVLLVSMVMIISGNAITNYLSGALKINSFDVRPSFSATMGVIKNQWMQNPVTGAGANNWDKLWAAYRPLEVNQSNFWNANFFFGSGLIPTLFGTLGLLGAFAILAFFYFYAKEGLKAFFAPAEMNGASQNRFLPVATFLTSLFLWVAAFIYTPGIAVLALAFIFTGLFAASLARLGTIGTIRINIFSNPKTNFISVLSVVVLMVGVVAAEYFVWEKIVASVVFNKAVTAYNENGDLAKAQAGVARAIGVRPTDLYQKTGAELYLLAIEKIAASIPVNGQISDAQRNELQNNVARAVEYGRAAVASDPKNYENHFTLGRIYESLAIKGIAGAAENAKESFAQAEKLNPQNPAIQLSYARLAIFGGDIPLARNYINKALEFKSNYTDAYFILAQLEAASNNIAGVIRAIESATIADPLNAGLYFQLGLVKYQTGDFPGATDAFERAIIIVPDYANAKYFLGLSYYRLGKKAETLKQFEDLKMTNPDNKEVDLILSNLKANKDLFTGATPPIDNKPEKRKEPPIEE